MKTILVLALMVAVCMCSGDASRMVRFGKSKSGTPSLSAGGEAAYTFEPDEKWSWSQDDREIWYDFMKRYEKDKKREMKKIMERAGDEEPTIDLFDRIPQGSLTKQDKAFFKERVCRILKLRGIASNHVIMKIVLKIGCLSPAFKSFLDHAARKGPARREWVERVFKFMLKVVKGPEKISANPESSSQKSGDNQKGMGGGCPEQKHDCGILEERGGRYAGREHAPGEHIVQC
jgi:hypothetical protein